MNTKEHEDLIVDRFGRRFRNLRVSLTAACNYACTYCVPNGKKLQAASYELSSDEMIRAVSLLVECAGIEQIRITGGEPLLSPKFDETLNGIMKLGLKDAAITTNGQLLLRKADTIIQSGIKRLNISLDTLDASKFRSIARSGDLNTVLSGIDLMLDAGLKIKINMVPMRFSNDDQIVPMLDYCLSRGIELRYIELMNMGHLRSSNEFVRQFFSMEELLELIGQHFIFERTNAPFDSTAVRFAVPGRGNFGVIANESEPFCKTCTRLRLSSNGHIYGCLSNAHSQDMKPILGMDDIEAKDSLRQLLQMALKDKQTHGFTGEVTVMKFIGG